MAFKTREQIEASRAEHVAREAVEAAADHARRSEASRKRVVITLEGAPDVRFTQGSDKVVAFRGREAGRDNSLSAVYFVPGHEKRDGFGREDLDDRVDSLKAGDKVSLAGHWAKRKWNDREGAQRETWEFRTQRFERGDVTLEAMERAAKARIDVGVKTNGAEARGLEAGSMERRVDEFLADAGREPSTSARGADAPRRDPFGVAALQASEAATAGRRWTEDELVAAVPSLLRPSGGYDPYAGIGSRETTQEVCDDMTAAARVLEARGFTLRSGFAGGADTAFELGTARDDQREIFAPWKGFGSNPNSRHEEKRWSQIRRYEQITGERFVPAKACMLEGAMARRSEELAAPHHPKWHELPDGHRRLHARNMGQVLGPNLDVPARFEMAWTVDGKATGGTGQAIRVAEASGIPVLNMHNPRIRAAVLSELGLEPQRDLARDLEVADRARAARAAGVSAPSGVSEPSVGTVPALVSSRVPDGGFDLKAPASHFVPDDRAAPFCKVKDENGLYSNMHNGAPIVVDGVTWRSTEALYQAARFPHRPDIQREIWLEENAYTAKTKAYEYIDQTRPDWQEVKDHMMAFAITQKLQDRAFSELVERNRGKEVVEISARDRYWGAAKVEGGYRGQNQLGSLHTQLSEGARMNDLPPGTTFPSREYMEGREAKAPALEAGPAPRSVSYEKGSVVDHGADVLVNTVNSQLSEWGNGVMGAGVAKAFKDRYGRAIMKDYEQAIRSGELKPGRAMLFDLPDGRKWAALATKDHYRDGSRIEWVDSGLKELGEKVRAAGLKSVAIPPPGCGNGGLDWKDVEPLVHRHLAGIDVAIYAKPSGAIVANDIGPESPRAAPVVLREPTLRASMYFAYQGQKRPEVGSDTTFDAIKAGERTSTTRFPEWPGYDRWKTLEPGSVVRFYADKEMRGEKVDVVVLGVKEVDLARMSPAQMEGWSKAEGWSEAHGRDLGRRHGTGLQIRYDLPENVDADRLARAREEQRGVDASPPAREQASVGREASARQPAPMDVDAVRRAKQRAAMGRGLG